MKHDGSDPVPKTSCLYQRLCDHLTVLELHDAIEEGRDRDDMLLVGASVIGESSPRSSSSR
jgi:hypothetical protein